MKYSHDLIVPRTLFGLAEHTSPTALSLNALEQAAVLMKHHIIAVQEGRYVASTTNTIDKPTSLQPINVPYTVFPDDACTECVFVGQEKMDVVIAANKAVSSGRYYFEVTVDAEGQNKYVLLLEMTSIDSWL